MQGDLYGKLVGKNIPIHHVRSDCGFVSVEPLLELAGWLSFKGNHHISPFFFEPIVIPFHYDHAVASIS